MVVWDPKRSPLIFEFTKSTSIWMKAATTPGPLFNPINGSAFVIRCIGKFGIDAALEIACFGDFQLLPATIASQFYIFAIFRNFLCARPSWNFFCIFFWFWIQIWWNLSSVHIDIDIYSAIGCSNFMARFWFCYCFFRTSLGLFSSRWVRSTIQASVPYTMQYRR